MHLKGGARKVLISAPGKNAGLTVVIGVNDAEYDPQRHEVISCPSCTAKCVAPMIKVLHDAFGLVQGFMTNVHAYTGDQMLLDGPQRTCGGTQRRRQHRADHYRGSSQPGGRHSRAGRAVSTEWLFVFRSKTDH